MKPTLDLYVGHKVIAITRGEEEWEWGIKLAGDVEIRNKDELEVFRPIGLVNHRLTSISYSERDTSIHFMRNGQKATISLKPTGYVILDPRYGGEAYPQWPEFLDDMGITANEGKAEPSARPLPDWIQAERRIAAEQQRRVQDEAAEFLKEEDQ